MRWRFSCAATVPNCHAWDPAFAAELAVILDQGARAMMTEGRDEFHYVTVMNEPYAQPDLPEGVEADLLKGLYRLGGWGDAAAPVRAPAPATTYTNEFAQRAKLRYGA